MVTFIGIWSMRGCRWSDDVCDVVLRASELGVDQKITEAITGVSRRSINVLLLSEDLARDPAENVGVTKRLIHSTSVF